MDVSVVIPAYDAYEFIGRTLESVEKQVFSGSYEIIVVDNGSTDGTAKVVRRNFPWITLLQELKPGANSARECGRRKATGEIIAFLDADTEVPRDWLERGLRHFRESDIVALTGPYLFYDGRIRDDVYAYLQRWLFFPLSKRVAEQSGMSLAFFANMFVRAGVLENDLHGLDTSIVFDGDDVDTATRLSWVGKVLYAQDMCVRTSARGFQKGLVRKVYRHYKAAREISRRLKKAHVRVPA
ncbi:MAG: family 2 glycosyl transferase [Parcubacteria group bacterium GW2011_GWA2_47_9]|nr:MAG: family 2 glycosyl transferase [Parcubacteria group bacterium GW2011_GWA2_47_9]